MELCNKKNWTHLNHHLIWKEQSGSDLINHNLYYRNSAKFQECLLLFPTFVQFTKQNNCRITQYCLMEFLLTGPTVVSRRVIQASHLPCFAYYPPLSSSTIKLSEREIIIALLELDHAQHIQLGPPSDTVTGNMLSG